MKNLSAARVLSLLLILAASTGSATSNNSIEQTPATARKAIESLYQSWSKARVAMDRGRLESMLGSEFRVVIGDETLDTAQFLDEVTAGGDGAKLDRFDVRVLSVQRDGDAWVAVIEEKVEFVLKSRDESPPKKTYSLWVTRDGFRQEGGKWLFTYSEAIGWETWRGGEEPPFEDW